MMKTLWITKDNWLGIQSIVETMMKSNSDLTINKVLNKILRSGIYAMNNEAIDSDSKIPYAYHTEPEKPT